VELAVQERGKILRRPESNLASLHRIASRRNQTKLTETWRTEICPPIFSVLHFSVSPKPFPQQPAGSAVLFNGRVSARGSYQTSRSTNASRKRTDLGPDVILQPLGKQPRLRPIRPVRSFMLVRRTGKRDVQSHDPLFTQSRAAPNGSGPFWLPRRGSWPPSELGS